MTRPFTPSEALAAWETHPALPAVLAQCQRGRGAGWALTITTGMCNDVIGLAVAAAAFYDHCLLLDDDALNDDRVFGTVVNVAHSMGLQPVPDELNQHPSIPDGLSLVRLDPEDDE